MPYGICHSEGAQRVEESHGSNMYACNREVPRLRSGRHTDEQCSPLHNGGSKPPPYNIDGHRPPLHRLTRHCEACNASRGNLPVQLSSRYNTGRRGRRPLHSATKKGTAQRPFPTIQILTFTTILRTGAASPAAMPGLWMSWGKKMAYSPDCRITVWATP